MLILLIVNPKWIYVNLDSTRGTQSDVLESGNTSSRASTANLRRYGKHMRRGGSTHQPASSQWSIDLNNPNGYNRSPATNLKTLQSTRVDRKIIVENRGSVYRSQRGSTLPNCYYKSSSGRTTPVNQRRVSQDKRASMHSHKAGKTL